MVPDPWEIGEPDAEREKSQGEEERNDFTHVYYRNESTNEVELRHCLEEIEANLLSQLFSC